MHMIQYALVGEGIVYHTEGKTDEQVRSEVFNQFYSRHPVERYDRCPACEAWTREGGRLRKDIDCPAVQAALLKAG